MLAAVGHWARQKVKTLLYAFGFSLKALFETVFFLQRKQVGYKVLVMQILFTGVEALSVITILAVSSGAIIIIFGIQQVSALFIEAGWLYDMLVMIVIRELGPVLIAFIIIARSGTAIAAELGNMVVTHQIEAYVSVGINPFSYLVVPRVLGVTISLIFLNIYFNFISLFGSFFIVQFFAQTTISIEEYFNNVLKSLKFIYIFSSLIKSFIFGLIISIVAVYQGFNVKIASYEVPQVVIKAVQQSVGLIIVADIIIVTLMLAWQGSLG
jgi:phospholipid/cholesterol/gamma-HCH transport system permease protein